MANHKAHKQPKSQERQRARELLLEGMRYPDVAKAVGVHPITVYKWRRQPEFARRLAEGQAARLAEAEDGLKAGSVEAMAFLRSLLTNEDAPYNVRKAAADSILDRAGITSKAGPQTVIHAAAKVTEKDLADATRMLEDELRAKGWRPPEGGGGGAAPAAVG